MIKRYLFKTFCNNIHYRSKFGVSDIFLSLTDINTFINQKCVKLIKSDNKDEWYFILSQFLIIEKSISHIFLI